MCSFYLADVEGPPLKGLPTGEALGIIKINNVDVIATAYEEGHDDDKVSKSDAVYIDPSTLTC